MGKDLGHVVRNEFVDLLESQSLFPRLAKDFKICPNKLLSTKYRYLDHLPTNKFTIYELFVNDVFVTTKSYIESNGGISKKEIEASVLSFLKSAFKISFRGHEIGTKFIGRKSSKTLFFDKLNDDFELPPLEEFYEVKEFALPQYMSPRQWVACSDFSACETYIKENLLIPRRRYVNSKGDSVVKPREEVTPDSILDIRKKYGFGIEGMTCSEGYMILKLEKNGFEDTAREVVYGCKKLFNNGKTSSKHYVHNLLKFIDLYKTDSSFKEFVDAKIEEAPPQFEY